MSLACRTCHGLDDAGDGFSFAFARSANNNLNSLFYRKPTGGCTAGSPCSGATPPSVSNHTGHSGGLSWAIGSAGELAARSWILNGRGL
jgi:hypothetical protein